MSNFRYKPFLGLASGLATVALLPAWDAVVSLPGQDRGWEPLAWVLGATLFLTGLVVFALSCRTPRVRLVCLVATAAVVTPLLVDSFAFVVQSTKDVVMVLAGPHYGQMRAVALVLIVAAIVGLGWVTLKRGWRFLGALAGRAFEVIGVLPFVFIATFALGSGEGTKQADVEGKKASHTTVVLVFDELDARVMERMIDRLPNFRRLQSQALSARAMYPPANYTSESLPGMLTGDKYELVHYERKQISVLPANQQDWQSISTRPSFLKMASERRLRVDVIGWHLPYCWVFSELSSCWDDARWKAPGRWISLPEWLNGHSWLQKKLATFELEPVSADVREYSRIFFAQPSNYRLQHIGEIFSEQSTRLRAVLSARRSELVFAHLACPHPPSLDPNLLHQQDMFQAYEQNLRSCDDLLGEVWRLLDGTSREQSWALVVTSDHWFRGLDWLDEGRPNVIPSRRQVVPFQVLLSKGGGADQSTPNVATSHVLPALVEVLISGQAEYEEIRALIDAQGDGTTQLRKF